MTKRAIIIGAGIAGLATALRLHQAGWTPLVAERSPERRRGGYTVAFSGIGYDAAERMGILPDLIERNIVPERVLYVRPDGRPRFSLPQSTIQALTGARALSLTRGDLEDVLYNAVAEHAEIRFGRQLTKISQDAGSVTATFADQTADQTSVTADLLVGADGLHSTTRTLVFGTEDSFRLDLDHMVAVFRLGRQPAGMLPRTTASLTATGRTFAVIDDGTHTPMAFFAYRTKDPQAERAAGAREALRRAYAGVGWATREILADLDDDGEVYFDSVSQIRMPQWHRGRVVLVGDAAWCVTLFAGFGSALAVAGADRLGALLDNTDGTDDLDAALAAWESELRPEAEAKQRLARRVRGLFAPSNKATLFLRDLPLRTASYAPVRAVLQRRLQIKG